MCEAEGDPRARGSILCLGIWGFSQTGSSLPVVMAEFELRGSPGREISRTPVRCWLTYPKSDWVPPVF